MAEPATDSGFQKPGGNSLAAVLAPGGDAIYAAAGDGCSVGHAQHGRDHRQHGGGLVPQHGKLYAVRPEHPRLITGHECLRVAKAVPPERPEKPRLMGFGGPEMVFRHGPLPFCDQ